MAKDIAKLVLTSLVLAVLLLAASGGGILAGRWTHKCPDGKVWTGRDVKIAIDHVNKQIFVEHGIDMPVHYSDVPNGLWVVLEKIGIKQDFTVLIRGRVPAGFDLDELDQKHIWTSADGKRVQLILPAPKIFEENVAIDFENSYVIGHRDTCPNWFCDKDLDAYQNEVLPLAKEDLVERALEGGILEEAAKDGKEFYEKFLTSLGFERVDVIVTGYGF